MNPIDRTKPPRRMPVLGSRHRCAGYLTQGKGCEDPPTKKLKFYVEKEHVEQEVWVCARHAEALRQSGPLFKVGDLVKVIRPDHPHFAKVGKISEILSLTGEPRAVIELHDRAGYIVVTLKNLTKEVDS
jgi:hypothetical protein